MQYNGFVSDVRNDRVYVSVLGDAGVEVDLVLPVELFNHWGSVSAGDLFVYKIWRNDGNVLQHSVTKATSELTKDEMQAILDDIKEFVDSLPEAS